MALPDELSAANIAILVSKSAAETARMKLAYGALFCILRFRVHGTAGPRRRIFENAPRYFFVKSCRHTRGRIFNNSL